MIKSGRVVHEAALFDYTIESLMPKLGGRGCCDLTLGIVMLQSKSSENEHVRRFALESRLEPRSTRHSEKSTCRVELIEIFCVRIPLAC